MLAVAVHGQHTFETALPGFAKPVAQCFALALALCMAQQDDGQVGDAFVGAVGGSIVHHDHVGAVRKGAFHHFADAQ